jgi:hypothetical protein
MPCGNSKSASGLPRVSATIRSRTLASTRPGVTAERRARASSSARPVSELGQSGQVLLFAGLSDGEHHHHRLGQYPPGDEPERLTGRGVKPLCVIDETQQRTLARHFRQQGERGQRHEKAVGVSPDSRPNATWSALLCGSGRVSTQGSIGAQSLVESGKRQLHFGLHPGDPGHAKTRSPLGTLVQECGLADSRLTAHDQRRALPQAPLPARGSTGPVPKSCLE